MNKKKCWAPVAHTYILNAQEAEIRRAEVQGQPGKIAHETSKY
jgi:hypothetical protein